VIAGVVAAVIGYFGVIQTINAEERQFHREKQQETYAELLTGERALRRLADEYMLGLAARETPDKLAERKQAIDAAHLEVSQAANNVAIIGTPWAAIAAIRIDEIHVSVRGVVAGTSMYSQVEPLPDEEKQKFQEHYDSLSKELDDVVVKFMQNARDDLGSNVPR
jgi:hypothetical protein